MGGMSSPNPNDPTRPITGVHARAERVDVEVDPCAVGLAGALRHLAKANATAAFLADDVAEAEGDASDPHAVEARRRMGEAVRRLQRELALTLRDLVQGPDEE